MGHKWLLIAPFYISNNSACVFLFPLIAFQYPSVLSVTVLGFPGLKENARGFGAKQTTQAVGPWSSGFTCPGLCKNGNESPPAGLPWESNEKMRRTVLGDSRRSIKVSYYLLYHTNSYINITSRCTSVGGSHASPHKVPLPAPHPLPRAPALSL